MSPAVARAGAPAPNATRTGGMDVQSRGTLALLQAGEKITRGIKL